MASQSKVLIGIQFPPVTALNEEDSMSEGFWITRMYHPSFHAPDLGEVEAWFERVFGAPSTNISETFKGRATSSYPTTYSTFTPVADVLMDTIEASSAGAVVGVVVEGPDGTRRLGARRASAAFRITGQLIAPCVRLAQDGSRR